MIREDTTRAEFINVLKSFDYAMLVTHDRHDGLRSRPMAIAEATDSGRLWFISNVESGKQDELAEDPHVNVAMQGDGRFLSISGRARVVRDRKKAEQLWSEMQRLWFPEGPHDPHLVLIEVEPVAAEYWDGSGIKGLRYLLAGAEAIVRGRQLDEDARAHGKVDLD